MTRFSDRMLPEVVQAFWAALQRGEFITDAAVQAGTYRKKGARWVAAAGGVRPRRGRDLQGRYLSFVEREEIALARAGGQSMREIAARLGAQSLDDQPRAGPAPARAGAIGRASPTRWPMPGPAG